jgi:recombinational DNA repair ATPase RecF
MATAVKYIRAVGIHGRYDLELDFYPGVNILYGKNGTGKTTLLHILANILKREPKRRSKAVKQAGPSRNLAKHEFVDGRFGRRPARSQIDQGYLATTGSRWLVEFAVL